MSIIVNNLIANITGVFNETLQDSNLIICNYWIIINNIYIYIYNTHIIDIIFIKHHSRYDMLTIVKYIVY